ncbi:MAG: hypothetical protein ACD_3C00111G0014 [uncultured bacterium (gcode 4)]|uniref:Uncharacterized protein n=1 Tax=uncultured bacterium (gcode 4) TaxID=1234023 RepID=K2G1A9_9BACT|nr:MAG: hypothetical protein ACD_3C00111G0014 [uncultured bacterium (gcode 4)]
MKNIFKNLKSWFLFWIWIAFALWIFWIVYAAISTVNSWDSLTTKWNEVVATINWWTITPAWAVMTFNLASCPSWWVAADWTSWTPDLRGTFIRWMNWVSNWRDSARALWDYQDDALQWFHIDLGSYAANLASGWWTQWYPFANWSWTRVFRWPISDWTNWAPRTARKQGQKMWHNYIALSNNCLNIQIIW